MPTTMSVEIIPEDSLRGLEGYYKSKGEEVDVWKITSDLYDDLKKDVSYVLKRITEKFIECPKVDAEDNTGTLDWPVAIEFDGIATLACIEFCNSHGLISFLRQYYSQINRIFPNAKKTYAELDCFEDNESEDVGHVVMRVEVESDQETALREYDLWIDWVIENIAPYYSSFFTLTVKRV